MDFRELIEYLDGKFNGIDLRFNGIDQRFDSVDLRFDSVDRRFVKVESEIQELRDEVRDIYDGLDTYSKNVDDCLQEMTLLNRQANRHENWIQLLARKIGLKLDYYPE
jgi:hypothetical protein